MLLKSKKRLFKFLGSFCVTMSICLVVTYVYIDNKCKLESTQMEQLVSIKSNKINNVITALLYKTQVLSALVIQNNGNIVNFENVAANIFDDPAIKNLLLAPNGIVSHVYPMENNEKVIGFDMFSDAIGNREARLAKESGKLVLGGPFELVQGSQALVGRLPVFLGKDNKQKTFWGIVSVTLNYPEALKEAELESLKNQNFAYEIWRYNPDTKEKQIISNSNYYYNKNSKFVEQELPILNANWYFKLSPIKMWYEYQETWIFTIFGLLLSFLLASIVLNNSDLKEMQYHLEILTYKDPLTDVYNRRGIFQLLNELIATQDSKFIIVYIDLNKFKMVNDRYGHNVGDKILCSFVEIVNSKLTDNQVISRLGGDEFIILFKNTDNVQEIDDFFNKIKSDFINAIPINDTKYLDITFSKGIAIYPRDGDSIDVLIAHSDTQMYQEKKEMYARE